MHLYASRGRGAWVWSVPFRHVIQFVTWFLLDRYQRNRWCYVCFLVYSKRIWLYMAAGRSVRIRIGRLGGPRTLAVHPLGHFTALAGQVRPLIVLDKLHISVLLYRTKPDLPVSVKIQVPGRRPSRFPRAGSENALVGLRCRWSGHLSSHRSRCNLLR